MKDDEVWAKALSILSWMSAVIPLAVICVICSSPVWGYVYSRWIVERMAYELAPEPYPNAELQRDWVSGGLMTMWDRKSYSTTDSLDAVLTHFEEQGFEMRLIDGGDEARTGYRGVRCNDSPLAISETRSIVGGRYPWYSEDENLPVPCVSVSAYERENEGAGIVFEIWISWPAS